MTGAAPSTGTEFDLAKWPSRRLRPPPARHSENRKKSNLGRRPRFWWSADRPDPEPATSADQIRVGDTEWDSRCLEAVDVYPVCGSDRRVVLYEGLRDYVVGAPGSWTLRRCIVCGSGYLDPRPTSDSVGMDCWCMGSAAPAGRSQPSRADHSTYPKSICWVPIVRCWLRQRCVPIVGAIAGVGSAWDRP